MTEAMQAAAMDAELFRTLTLIERDARGARELRAMMIETVAKASKPQIELASGGAAAAILSATGDAVAKGALPAMPSQQSELMGKAEEMDTRSARAIQNVILLAAKLGPLIGLEVSIKPAKA